MPPSAADKPPQFSDRLAAIIDRFESVVCVGLDPVVEKLPSEIASVDPAARIAQFTLGVLDAVAGVAPVVKFQSACYERYGPPGLLALHAGIAHAHTLGLLVILDAKRGDIGISAEHYAAASFSPTSGRHAAADAITVSPYLGPDTIEPFLDHPGRGVFVLVRTSNPGSDAIQSLRLADGRTVSQMVADQVAALGATRRGTTGLSSVGAVVGATKSEDAAALRARMPDAVFLIPGFGAQGGTANDIRAMVRSGRHSLGERGILVTASRSVIFPSRQTGQSWQDAVKVAVRSMQETLAGALH